MLPFSFLKSRLTSTSVDNYAKHLIKFAVSYTNSILVLMNRMMKLIQKSA